MPFPNPDTQFKPGQSGNPNGKPKGTKHLSKWIQELLNDEGFSIHNPNGTSHKGAPIKALIEVAVTRALRGDIQWASWLARHGYGNSVVMPLDHSARPAPILNGISRPPGGL